MKNQPDITINMDALPSSTRIRFMTEIEGAKWETTLWDIYQDMLKASDAHKEASDDAHT